MMKYEEIIRGFSNELRDITQALSQRITGVYAWFRRKIMTYKDYPEASLADHEFRQAIQELGLRSISDHRLNELY